MYARNPSIILQNMNFSRYYRYRAQLIYSFDLNIIKLIYVFNQTRGGEFAPYLSLPSDSYSYSFIYHYI